MDVLSLKTVNDEIRPSTYNFIQVENNAGVILFATASGVIVVLGRTSSNMQSNDLENIQITKRFVVVPNPWDLITNDLPKLTRKLLKQRIQAASLDTVIEELVAKYVVGNPKDNTKQILFKNLI